MKICTFKIYERLNIVVFIQQGSFIRKKDIILSLISYNFLIN